MWTVYEQGNFYRVLERLPIEVLKRYEKWKDVVAHSGLYGLRQIKGFHDEALRGKWNGYRSSRLGEKWRVIYKAEKDRFLVLVIDINAHDYKKR